MILGIDARTLYHARTGITRYLEWFVQLWEESELEGECRLYLPRRKTIQTTIVENHQVKFCYYAEHWPEFLAFHFVLPFRLKRDGVGAFWGIQHELPLGIRERFCGKLLLTIHDLSLFHLPASMRHRGLLRIWLKKWALKKALTAADAVIGISEATCRDLREMFPMVQEKLVKIFAFFLPRVVPAVRPAALSQLGSHRFFLSVGTLQPRKNLLRAFQAFEKFCATDKNLYYVVAAPNQWGNAAMQHWFQQTPHKDRFLFLPSANDAALAWLYQNAVALIYPSLLEGWGRPILEAFSYGCPVLTSQSSSLPEVGGDLACYVDPYSVIQIKEGMQSLLQDAVWKQRVQSKGGAWLQRFDGHTSFREFQRILALPRRSIDNERGCPGLI